MASYRVIGLISGTSMDGIDVAAAELHLIGQTVELEPLGHLELTYPEQLRSALVSALPPAECSAERLCRLDTTVGQAFAAAAGEALATVSDGRADLIASLGQTVYHWVEGDRCLGTLQLGQPAWIAEATGLPVVADLRARDVAAGGHGAPLAGLFDELWLAGRPPGSTVAALNLGGVANITVPAGPGATTLAFDTGPGNALLDAAARAVTGGTRHYDRGGELASAGTVRPDLLDLLLAEPYYAAPPPKSTGKELFHGDYLAAMLRQVPPVADIDLLATLVELTARTVADACAAHGVHTVIASGGGVRNPALLAALRRALHPAELVTSDALGVPAEAKEAYLAALLGYLTWHAVPGNRPSATGAAGPRVLGSITPGREPLRLPDPVTTPVTALRVRTPAVQAVSPHEPGGPHGRT